MIPVSSIKKKNWIVAVDASLMIYQTVTATTAISGKHTYNNDGHITDHLGGILKKCTTFLEHNIRPIFVFDGDECPMKSNTLDTRHKEKDKARKDLESLDNPDDISPVRTKLINRSFSVTDDIVHSLKIMLDVLGIPWIQAIGEADTVCVWLTKIIDVDTGKRLVKGVCSEDMDMLTLGAKYLLRNMSCFFTRNHMIHIYKLPKIRDLLNLSESKFISLCTLMGTDYASNIKGIAGIKSFELIEKHDTLKSVLKSIPSEDCTKKQKKKYLEIQKYFETTVFDLNNDVDFDIYRNNLFSRCLQMKSAMDYLCHCNGLNVQKTAQLLNKYQIAQINLSKNGVKFYRNTCGRKIINKEIARYKLPFGIVPLDKKGMIYN